MRTQPRLPLKVVPALSENFYNPQPGGGEPKVFGEVTPELRQQLAASVVEIRNGLRAQFAEFPGLPAVATLTVKEDALAKSHRPSKVFSDSTCPIIGSEGLGDLFLSVTPTGLDTLARAIESDQTKYGVANISTIKQLAPFKPRVALGQDLLKPAKVKLFLHHSNVDDAMTRQFLALLAQFQSEISEVRYGQGLKVFKVMSSDAAAVAAIQRFVGTQSIESFPTYFPVRTVAVPVRSMIPEDFPQPNPDEEYPVIGIIDSGTPKGDPTFAPWVVARESYVPESLQDNTHGTFVAALVIHGRHLNNDDRRFPSCSSKIVDVVAVEPTGTSEDVLLATIEDAVSKFPFVRTWNLSIGTDEPISDRKFSDLAVAFDRIQDEKGVTFVLAAGNYAQPPFRAWPSDLSGDADRICSPADSVRSIVVGSISHLENASSKVKALEPSPFSRRGPGPLYLPKPELVHIGGNCRQDGICSQIGVLSIDGRGNVAEDIGTSYATPLVSTVAGNVAHRVVGGASRLLTRALLVHSAAMGSDRITDETLRYKGFGVPGDIEDILGCEPWQCTVIFEIDVQPSVRFEKAIFPMPPSLFSGDKLKADVLMTLVYEPALDASFGSEYCRSNIEVSMGTYEPDSDGKFHQCKEVPEDPRLTGSGYERDLVEHGFKWSPIKVYRRRMPRGVEGKLWRLDIGVQHRSGHMATKPQSLVLIITIGDPNKQAPVYNEMVNQMQLLGWAAADLQIRPRLRT